MHTGHLHIDGRKMSKSLKNFITVRTLLETLCTADDFRIFCIQFHYRSTLHFTQDRLDEAKRSVPLAPAWPAGGHK
jgi:cysteinyl-tRNA synthetase